MRLRAIEVFFQSNQYNHITFYLSQTLALFQTLIIVLPASRRRLIRTTTSSSAAPTFIADPLYGMPPGYFVGQINNTTFINPDKTSQIGQTGAIVVVPSSPTPLATIPISDAPS